MEDLETVFDEITPPGVVATFSEGQTCVTAHGLHQWDYGATLEIRDSALANRVLEFHFAYPGAREAIVAGRAFLGGVCQVLIPDVCLEQPAPVTVWVYETRPGSMANTQGRTIRTIVLPIIPRARPAALPTMPEEVSNLYTETLTMVTAAAELAVENLESAKQAQTAAEKAAADADTGLTRLATLTQNLENGNVLPKASQHISGPWTKGSKLTDGYGLYAIRAVPKTGGAATPVHASLTCVVDFQGMPVYSCPGAWWFNANSFKVATLYIGEDGGLSLGICYVGGNQAASEVTDQYDFYFYYIGEVYDE